MKKLISLLVSLAILAIIYWRLSRHGHAGPGSDGKSDLEHLRDIFLGCNGLWMVISLGMVIPLTLFTSWRLQQLMPQAGQLGFGEANRLILVASVLNLVLPSKMGDIAKAYFMRDRGHMEGSLALSLVVFEKACDMLSLLFWCVFGLVWCILDPAIPLKKDAIFWTLAAAVASMLVSGVLLLSSQGFAGLFFDLAKRFAPGKYKVKLARLHESWGEMHGYFWSSRARLYKVTATSIFIWFLHLLQIWMFIFALRAYVPFLANLALSPLGILAGLMPLTQGGMGTRDAALIYFYEPYIGRAAAAALGILCTARYVLPAIGGMPFAGGYFQRVKKMQAG